jgi:hypothetical protein
VVEVGGVGEVHDLATGKLRGPPPVRRPPHPAQLPPRLDKSWFAMNRSQATLFPIANQQHAGCSAAEGVRLLQYCVEHRLKVAGRAVDDLQDLGGCGLLLKRLARLGQ